jgi:hypothetical protein
MSVHQHKTLFIAVNRQRDRRGQSKLQSNVRMPGMRQGTKEDLRQMSQILFHALVAFLRGIADMTILYWAPDIMGVTWSHLSLQGRTER